MGWWGGFRVFPRKVFPWALCYYARCRNEFAILREAGNLAEIGTDDLAVIPRARAMRRARAVWTQHGAIIGRADALAGAVKAKPPACMLADLHERAIGMRGEPFIRYFPHDFIAPLIISEGNDIVAIAHGGRAHLRW